jgi:hypothetical protein
LAVDSEVRGMKKTRGKPLVLLLAIPVAGALCAVAVANAQQTGLVCGTIPLTMQTTEPATGFTGACLAQFTSYEPQLPTVCFSPPAPLMIDGGASEAGAAVIDGGGAAGASSGVTYGKAPTTCTMPAANSFRSYASLAPNYDSYTVLMTCYPHGAGGKCTLGFAVSKSCCDYGTSMISLDGKTATGLVNFQ